jgi:hypothetical protein
MFSTSTWMGDLAGKKVRGVDLDENSTNGRLQAVLCVLRKGTGPKGGHTCTVG